MRFVPLVFALLLLPSCLAEYRWEPCKYVVRLYPVVEGRVFDLETGEGVPASIGENLPAREDGGFKLVLPSGGSYSLRFTFPGYENHEENFTIESRGYKFLSVGLRYDPFDLALSENSGSLSKRSGERWGSKTLTVAVERKNGYSGQIEFSLQSQGVSASFSPPILPPGSTSCQLTLLPSESLGAGRYEVRILGRDNGGRLVENVPYTLTLSIEATGGGGGGGGQAESRTHSVSIPLYFLNSKTLRKIPTVSGNEVKITSVENIAAGISSSGLGNIFLDLGATVGKNDPPRERRFKTKIKVDTLGYHPQEFTVSGTVSIRWENMTCSVISVWTYLDPREGWVQLSWDKTPKLFVWPTSPVSESRQLTASGNYQWNSDYKLCYYPVYNPKTGKYELFAYGSVDEFWNASKIDPPTTLAKTKTPWGGTYQAKATGWVTGSNGVVVETQLRSEYVDARGEYAVVPSGKEEPVDMYVSISGPNIWQCPSGKKH